MTGQLKVDLTSSKIFNPSSIPIPLADVIEDLLALSKLDLKIKLEEDGSQTLVIFSAMNIA